MFHNNPSRFKSNILVLIAFVKFVFIIYNWRMAIVKADTNSIKQAAEIIKSGGVVAFPTETVYGLGANAYDRGAVKKIFELKGRPGDNPLIVHIAEVGDLYKISNIKYLISKEVIDKLIAKFWPGPLTLILPKNKNIPSEVSAGLNTVAVRMPRHPIALALIKEAGVPIAAPSANLSGKPSPTSATHVFDDFGDKILILDGGTTEVGLESTVLDLTVSLPVILRQGGVTYEDIRKVLPDIFYGLHLTGGKAKSPGMKYRHYAPKAKMFLAKAEDADAVDFINRFIVQNKDLKVGVLATDDYKNSYEGAFAVLSLGGRNDLDMCARNLFTTLRKFDSLNVDVIISEIFPEEGIGAAIMERIRKAAN